MAIDLKLKAVNKRIIIIDRKIEEDFTETETGILRKQINQPVGTVFVSDDENYLPGEMLAFESLNSGFEYVIAGVNLRIITASEVCFKILEEK